MPYASNPRGEPGSLVVVMQELRTVMSRETPGGRLPAWLASPRLNLEIDKYPRYEFVPDPERGPTARKQLPWKGGFIDHYPPTAERLDEEFGLLWEVRRWADGKPDVEEVRALGAAAISLNRAIWRDATLADYAEKAPNDEIGRYIQHLRRRAMRGTPGLSIRWGDDFAHEGGRTPSTDELPRVLNGGFPEHVLPTQRIVVDLGFARFHSWAICLNDAEHTRPCTCHFCMDSSDPDRTRDPGFAARLRSDPALAFAAEISTGSGRGPDGPLTAIRSSEPNLSSYGVRLVALFGRDQFNASLSKFDTWLGLRQSGKKPGRPSTRLDYSTYDWAARRRQDGRSLRQVYEEHQRRADAPTLSYETFRRKFNATRAELDTKPPVSAAGD